MVDFYVPESAMVIVAHPDDIEFTCAGTLARWAQRGTRLAYVLCTSGEVGFDVHIDRMEAIALREAEQRKAAQIVGVTDVTFLRHPDGLLQPTLELRRQLVRQIRRFRPEVVIMGDPTLVLASDAYINHPDHRAAAAAAIDAVFPAAGQPNLFRELEEEGLAAHKTRKVYITGWDKRDLLVDIGETIEVKIAALHAHASQMKGRDMGPRIREWARERAKRRRMRYAEGFRVVTLVSDEDWEKNNGRVPAG
jgi:LmbE family N-acetylglucosaminyl deacetylase